MYLLVLADFVQGIERFKKAAAEVKDVVLGAQCVSTTIMKHTSYGSRGNCRVAKVEDPTNRLAHYKLDTCGL